MIYAMMQDNYFGNLMLSKLDLLSAKLGLESRCPFTEPAYAHWVYNVPASFKSRDGWVKYFFKKSIEGVLPNDIIYRPKQGFRTPVQELFAGRLGEWARPILLETGFTKLGLLRRDALAALLDAHMPPRARSQQQAVDGDGAEPLAHAGTSNRRLKNDGDAWWLRARSLARWSCGRLVGLCVAALQLGGCVFYLNPLCNDQIKNGDETGIDCGGKCGRCNIGEGCRVDADCDEGNCMGGICTRVPVRQRRPRARPRPTSTAAAGPAASAPAAGSAWSTTDCFSGNCDRGDEDLLVAHHGVVRRRRARTPSGDKTYALFAGDLDGDGHVDLVAANEQASSLSVFLNSGDGTGTFQTLAADGNAFLTGFYPTGEPIPTARCHHRRRPQPRRHPRRDHRRLPRQLDQRPARHGHRRAGPQASSYPTVAGAETSNLVVRRPQRRRQPRRGRHQPVHPADSPPVR